MIANRTAPQLQREYETTEPRLYGEDRTSVSLSPKPLDSYVAFGAGCTTAPEKLGEIFWIDSAMCGGTMPCPAGKAMRGDGGSIRVMIIDENKREVELVRIEANNDVKARPEINSDQWQVIGKIEGNKMILFPEPLRPGAASPQAQRIIAATVSGRQVSVMDYIDLQTGVRLSTPQSRAMFSLSSDNADIQKAGLVLGWLKQHLTPVRVPLQ